MTMTKVHGKYEYNGKLVSIKELSDRSGVKQHTIRDRLRRGFTIDEAVKVQPVQDSVKDFIDASYWQDWIGLSISALYEIYWEWCTKHGYTTILQKQGFSRQLMNYFPMLKIVPTRKGDKCYRIIRER